MPVRLKLVALYGFKGSYAVLSLALGAVVARIWGVSSFATFAVMWTVLTVGLTVGSAGANFYLVELLPKLSSQEYSRQMTRLVRLSMLATVVSGLVAAVTLHALDNYWTAALALVPGAAHVVATGALIAEKRQLWSGFLDGVLRPAVSLALTGAAGLVGLSPAQGLTLGLAGGYVSTAAAGAWLVRRTLRQRHPVGSDTTVPVLKPLVIFVLMGVLTTLLRQADRFVVDAAGSAVQLASYAAAQNVANVVVYAVNSAAVLALPAIAATLAGRGTPTEMWVSLDRVCRPLVAFAATSALVAALLGDRILSVFGPEFLAGRWPLTVLLAGTAVSLTFGFPLSVLSMSDARTVLVWHLSGGTLALLLGSAVAVQHWGTTGVAVVNAACLVGVRLSMHVHCLLRGLPAYHVVPRLRASPRA